MGTVLEHPRFTYFRALRGVADYKLFFFPIDVSVQTVLRRNGLLQKRNDYGHLHYFTRETAERTLVGLGYTIVESVFTSEAIGRPSGSLGRALLKVPRKLLFRLRPAFAVHLQGGYRLLVLAQ